MNIENKEVWAPLYQWEDEYLISTLGRIKSVPRKNCKGQIRKPSLQKNGYYVINLTSPNKQRKRISVHKLVVETFIGPVSDGMQINHKNEIKTDNRLENLEIVTAKENSSYGTRGERISEKLSKPLLLKALESGKELKFKNDQEASLYFGYKSSRAVNALTQIARNKGINTINIKKVKFQFSYGNNDI